MSDQTYPGSCICGTVRFVAQGEVVRFTHCHCGRCRKATGTGHATNLILKPGRVTWLQGEEKVRRYRLAEAERFATSFCAECGSPLPRVAAELEMVVIPAGSLDTDPGLRPQGHIFWDSRAEWSCPAAGFPTYPEYPPTAG